MRIALFAADDVGVEVTRMLVAAGAPPVGLVLDAEIEAQLRDVR